MFNEQERLRVVAAVRDRVIRDKHVLEDIVSAIRDDGLKRKAREIKAYDATAIAIVSSDSGNHIIKFDPFEHHLIRVVDNSGVLLGLRSLALSEDLDALFADDMKVVNGKRNPVGNLIYDISIATGRNFSSFSEICPSISLKEPDRPEASAGWVISYRDLWEWAVLYDQIKNAYFGASTLILRDGLLRTKLFAKNYFRVLGDLIAERLKELNEGKKNVFVVGLAKSSSVIDLYRLALHTEDVFPSGKAYYAPISRKLEKRAYKYEEFTRGRERLPKFASGSEDALAARRNPSDNSLIFNYPDKNDSGGEDSKYVFGSMYFARFGTEKGDPIWAIDVFDDQLHEVDRIMGNLFNDSIGGFPVPFYPQALQNAHDEAKITDMDAQIVNQAVMEGVRDIVGKDGLASLDILELSTDVSGRRY